jgi:hypothetical protein
MAGVQEAYVTMTTGQRDVLLNTAREARAAADQAEARRKAEEQARRQAETRITEIERALRDSGKRAAEDAKVTDAQLKALHAEMLWAEQQQNDRLVEYAKEHREALEEQARQSKTEFGNLKNEMNRGLTAQRKDLERKLAKQRAEINVEIQKNRETINNVVERISRMEETSEKHHELAQYWVEQANGLVKDISRYRHELFAPGELGKLRNELANAARYIQTRAYQSAIITGREAFQNASDLKPRIINAENEWNQVYAVWRRESAVTASDFDDSTHLTYEIDTTEGREKIPARLDYWTGGKLGIAQSRLDGLQSSMSDINTLSVDTLLRGLDELIHLKDELSVVQKAGKENLLRSHNRYVEACRFADLLEENFAMNDCEGDYEEQEQRNAYIGIYKNNATGDAIAVRIQPVPDEAGIMSKDLIEVHYFTPSNNEEQHGRWTKKIEEELQKQGFVVGRFNARPGYENRSSDQRQMADIHWVRQKKASA